MTGVRFSSFAVGKCFGVKCMVKQWIVNIRDDILTKTKDMSREQAAEYVLTYYWYHMLLGALALGLALLLIYHVGWGRNRKPEFSCVIVNQEVDFPRDEEIAEDFSAFSGIRTKKVSVDSDYLISYEDVQLSEANESSYEKFFFNWSSGVIDAMILPESFYEYCLSLGGEFLDLRELGSGEEGVSAVCVKGTVLEKWLQMDTGDPLLLVFPVEGKHREQSRRFLEYVLESDCDVGK